MSRPRIDDFAVVTATTDLARAASCVRSWVDRAAYLWPVEVVQNGGQGKAPYLGTVPAFAAGLEKALASSAQIIACLHDDLEIDESGWDWKVIDFFRRHPEVGLVGFGGGTGLGAADIYQTPYDPMQLARQDFVSSLRDAEAHGRRGLEPERVSCLDGFCQIGRAEFWRGSAPWRTPSSDGLNLLSRFASWGLTHHWYDGQLGVEAARLGWQVWFLPVLCHHYGGRTAVGDPGYQEWARTQVEGGDQGFWERAHQVGWERSRGVLPLRVGR